ncbi:MAG: lamin tail domain-containing protein [Pirellulaceae bacterium]|nr:lamin tail domain-containing protein [Pirellulaceae bacterium]
MNPFGRRLQRNSIRRAKFESLESRLLLAGDLDQGTQPVIISEFVADSTSTLATRTRSSDGSEFAGEATSPDWIELFNSSAQRLDLGGMHLTDELTEGTKWQFPAATWVEPGNYLVVFASGNNITDPTMDENGFLHTNFRLSEAGEYLALTDQTGQPLHTWDEFPLQRTDISYGLPMTERTLLHAGSLEYSIPVDDALDPAWKQVGFEHASFSKGEMGALGFDRGDGEPETGQTIGAELIDRSRLDFSRGSMVIFESRPFQESGRVAEWSFYSEKTNSVTPLVFRSTDEGFEITGIGTTRNSDGSGVQTFPFERIDGSDLVESAEYFFGIKDGDNGTDVAGSIVWANSDTESVRRFNGPLSGKITLGEEFTGGRSFGREFSTQVTAITRLEGPILTELDTAMASASSLYVRYPFAVENKDTLKSLVLQVRYEDGFVAYLNGVEIARSNISDPANFDSIASSNRPLAEANRFESINVSQAVSHLTDGDNVLAIHAFDDRQVGSDFLIDAKLLGLDVNLSADFEYTSEVTPGQANQSEFYQGFVTDPALSHSRGIYDQTVELTLSSEGFPDATIYYTTDGTAPTPDNPTAKRYEQAFEVATTTVLRTASYHDDWINSNTKSHSFIFPEDVKAQAEMHARVIDDPVWGSQVVDSLTSLPTMSLMTAKPISVKGEIFTSAELIHPDGSTGFQIDAGVEVFGGTAVSFPKRSMRLSFKNIYGPTKLNFDVFADQGVSEFNQLLLRPGSHDTPFWDGTTGTGNYLRNRWVNDRQIEMGQPAPRGQFVHLYLNGVYWGQYQLLERPNAAFMAAHFGGQPEDYDAINAGRAIDGDEAAWNTLLNSLDKGYEEVKKYLDVENYADYILLEFYGGNNIDWREQANWMASRKRESGAGFQFFGWDSDLFMRIGAEIDIVNFGGPGLLATRAGGVLQYPEFLELLAERAQLHLLGDGILTDKNVRASIDELAATMRPAIVAETARWGSGRYTPDTWEAAVAWMRDTYVPADGPSRADTVIEQLRHADLFPLSDRPAFRVDGQLMAQDFIAADSQLKMAAENGDIYFTLDGSDPQKKAATVERVALFPVATEVRAHIPANDALNLNWITNDFNDSDWIPGKTGVGFDTTGELTPLIDLDIAEPMKGINATAYLRIPFQIENPAAFETLTLSLKYDDGFVAYLNGTEIARRNAPTNPIWNSRSTHVRENIEAIEFETFNLNREIELLQTGSNVLAIQALNFNATNVDLLMIPKLEAGTISARGLSPSAQKYTGPIQVPKNAVISARTLWTDQWSTLRTATSTPNPSPLRISEVMYHPADPTAEEIAAGFTDADEFEFIELVNISADTIDLTGADLRQSNVGGQRQGIEFAFGSGLVKTLEPNAHVLVVENSSAFQSRYGNQLPVAGQWTGGLSNRSEQITLSVNNQTLQQFSYHDDWYPETDGNGSSLEVINPYSEEFDAWNDASRWQASSTGGSPGQSTAQLVPGDSNRDGRFDSQDLVIVFQAGEYEDETPNNSSWEDGDWNNDGDFNTTDLVFAFQAGSYSRDATPLVFDHQLLLDIASAMSAKTSQDDPVDKFNKKRRLFEVD